MLARVRVLIIAMALMHVSILVMDGILDREKHGIAGIWEVFLIIVFFVGGYALIIFS